MSDPILIAIAVVCRDDLFLVGQRADGRPLAGLWEFPGGKVLCGETVEAAAVRECLEETGIRVEFMRPYWRTVHEYDHGTVDLNFLFCQPLDKITVPRRPYVWLPRMELRYLPFPAGNAHVIKSLVANREPALESRDSNGKATQALFRDNQS
jgi:mutator protein MutT